jgi:uncharacterized membrane protein
MRYRSIDLLRAYAIAVMVMVHFLENLSGTRDWSPDGLGAPIFAFLSGVSYHLWLASRQQRGCSADRISRETMRRGLFLIGLGFVFNALVWLPEDLFTWDVLTFLGSSMLVLNVARRMPAPALLLTIVLSVLLSPVMQKLADYGAWWLNGYFETEQTLSELLTGFLVTGYFPIFPWIALPLAGFMSAPALLNPQGTGSKAGKYWLLTCLSLTVLVALVLTLRWTTAWGRLWLPAWTMFPASLTYMSAALGIVVLLLAGLHNRIDQRQAWRIPEWLMSRAQRFSRFSLSIYLLHHVVHLWPLWLYGLWQTGEPTAYWGQVLSWWPAFFLSMLFLLICDRLLLRVERHRVPTIENLLRWLCE